MLNVLVALLAVLVAALAWVVRHGSPDVLNGLVVLALVVAVLALVAGPRWWGRPPL